MTTTTETLRRLVEESRGDFHHPKVHLLPNELPEIAGDYPPRPREASEVALVWVEGNPLSIEPKPGLLITDQALYADDLPLLRLPLENIVTESCSHDEGADLLYVNDLLVCTFPCAEPTLEPLLQLLRKLRSASRRNGWEGTVPALRPVGGSLPEIVAEPELLGGKYRLLHQLGRGTYGIVSVALDVRLDKLVAVKQLTSAAAHQPLYQARFIQEARAVSRLTNPHIAAVYALEHVGGTYYLVMEYLMGGTLKDRLTVAGRLAVQPALRIARDVLSGLDEAHYHGIVHRDLKPANILFDERGRAKLTDFGVAHVPTDAGGLELTGSGVPMGTVLYMSPEQVRGEPATPRCDLYSVGALLYRMLSGREVLDKESCRSLHQAFEQILDGNPPRLETVAEVPLAVADLVHGLLAKNVDDRPESAAEVMAAVDRLLGGEAPEAKERPAEPPKPDALDKYRKVLSLFLTDGAIVHKEREVLESKARQWGIPQRVADKVEEDLLSATGVHYSMRDILDFEETVRIFLTDGVLQPAERAMLERKAESCGLKDEVVQSIFQVVAHDLGVPLSAIQP